VEVAVAVDQLQPPSVVAVVVVLQVKAYLALE
jgi:hypothetical protein